MRFLKKKCDSGKCTKIALMVEITGLEPVTSWLPVKHSPNWAIPPWDNILFCLNRAAVLTAALLVEIRYVWNCKTFHLAWWVQRWKNSIICSLPKNSPPNCFLNGRLRIPGKASGFFGWTIAATVRLFLVEIRGFEPLTSWMRTKRSPNWAIPPDARYIIAYKF